MATGRSSARPRRSWRRCAPEWWGSPVFLGEFPAHAGLVSLFLGRRARPGAGRSRFPGARPRRRDPTTGGGPAPGAGACPLGVAVAQVRLPRRSGDARAAGVAGAPRAARASGRADHQGARGVSTLRPLSRELRGGGRPPWAPEFTRSSSGYVPSAFPSPPWWRRDSGAIDAVTVRPVGPPFERRLALGPRLARALTRHQGRGAAVVDEGPGLSGSSFAAVLDLLESSGWPESAHSPVSLSRQPRPARVAANRPVGGEWRATSSPSTSCSPGVVPRAFVPGPSP